jgi:hypothetical protein
MGPQLRELVLIAERKSDKFNLGIPRNAAGGAPLGLGQVPSLDFWVPLKGRRRPPTGTRPPITGVRGYAPDPISEKKEKIQNQISRIFSVFRFFSIASTAQAALADEIGTAKTIHKL